MGKQKNTEEFILEAKLIHGDKYDYSKVIYKKALEKVCIICPKHGEFWQTPNAHLDGKGCPVCGAIKAGEKIKQTLKEKKEKGIKTRKAVHNTEEFIEIAKERHKGMYIYSKTVYHKSDEKVCIICPKHGEFWQTPSNHVNGQGCPKCAIEKRVKSKLKDKEYFINKANYIHCNFYCYDEVNYERARKKVKIICPIHGPFWQSPDNHLKGCGCPSCQNSQLENKIRRVLTDYDIDFIPYYSPSWLVAEDGWHKQSIDFFIPEYNVGIECQGVQHFIEGNTFGSTTIHPKEFLKMIENRDDRKYNLCKEHGIRMIYFADKNHVYRYDLTIDIDLLLKRIKDLNYTA
jgi:hypothetical protein